jgi:hypothetical protein
LGLCCEEQQAGRECIAYKGLIQPVDQDSVTTTALCRQQRDDVSRVSDNVMKRHCVDPVGYLSPRSELRAVDPETTPSVHSA